MRYCENCGAEVEPGVNFCANCGHRLGNEITEEQSIGRYDPEYEQAVATELRNILSPQRILFMTIVTYGLYLFYWFYITWKQYRDVTGEQVYPVWHALTLLVPIYNLFRTHAHTRTFRDLMRDRGLLTTISVGWAVAAVWISAVIDGFSFRMTFGGEISQGLAVAVAILDGISITIVAWLLLHVQGNLNKYWHHVSEGTVTNARIGMGEVIFVVVGLLSWLSTFATLFSESYRLGA